MDNVVHSSQGFPGGSDPLSFVAVLDQLRAKHGWRLDRQIGQGGFAQVYKETLDGIPRAVKIPLHPLAGLPDRQKQRELESLEVARRMVGHPHIVGLVWYEWVGDYLITIWEWADGGSLEDMLRQYQKQGQPGIPLEKLLGYMAEAAKGIDDLNQQGIYHRDIKPANLLLFHDHVKLGDLGLAKVVGASTGTHTRAGTFGYLPPEAWEGKTSETIDLYGLAASYVKLRTGREPFGESPKEILDRQQQGQPILDGLTEAEKPLVLAALHPDPEKRFKRGAKAWVRELEQALKSPPHLPPKQSPSVPAQTAPSVPRPPAPPRPQPRPSAPFVLSVHIPTNMGEVLSVAFSPDGRQVLTGSLDGTARLWDAQTGQELRRFEGHTEPVWSVAFSPDGRQVLTGSLDKTARLWDAQTGRLIAAFCLFQGGGWATVTSEAFVYDGQESTKAILFECLRLFDPQTGQERPLAEADFDRFHRPDLVQSALADL